MDGIVGIAGGGDGVALIAENLQEGGDGCCVGAPVRFEGTCSSFLASSSSALVTDFPLEIGDNHRFSLPPDSSAPLVLVANGTGVAPMVSFCHARASMGDKAGPTVLFWGIADMASTERFLPAFKRATAKSSHIAVWVCCSREDAAFVVRGGAVVMLPTPKRARVGAFLRGEPPSTGGGGIIRNLFRRSRPQREGQQGLPVTERAKLVLLLQNDCCRVMICGVSALAAAIRDCFEHLLAGSALNNGGGEEEEETAVAEARRFLQRMDARGDWCLDVFNSNLGCAVPNEPTFAPWEVAHAHVVDGRALTSFRDAVYDLSGYLDVHPGGRKLLEDKLGRDCTAAFEASHGTYNTAIMAQMEVYRIGSLNTVGTDPCMGPLLNTVVEIFNYSRHILKVGDTAPGLRAGAHEVFLGASAGELLSALAAFRAGLHGEEGEREERLQALGAGLSRAVASAGGARTRSMHRASSTSDGNIIEGAVARALDLVFITDMARSTIEGVAGLTPRGGLLNELVCRFEAFIRQLEALCE